MHIKRYFMLMLVKVVWWGLQHLANNSTNLPWGHRLLHIFKCMDQTYFIKKANTMNPDQTASIGSWYIVLVGSSVEECLTQDWGALGSSLTGVSALCPWARHINPSLVLVQPRKTCPYIAERVLMGHKESNQTNKHSVCNRSSLIIVFARLSTKIHKQKRERAHALC